MNTRLIHGFMISMIVLLISSADPLKVFADEKKNTVVDSLGRLVDVPVVERIACMYAFTGHAVAMLGGAEKIVAVSNGLKRDVLLSTMYPSIRNAALPKFRAINIEELTGAKPDIVFIQSQTGRNPAIADKLDACGLTWIAVDFHNMAQQREVIDLIGRAIGASEKAVDYNAYYISCIDRVGQVVAEIPLKKRPRVYHATVEPTRTSPKNSLPADWIRTAGVINVAAQDPAGLLNGNHQVGIEQILLWNPDVILANEPGVADSIKKSLKWSAVVAVEDGRVYQMPIGISRWGHPGSLETPLAILWTAKTVYPDKFRDIDMPGELRHFYKTFFNYELSDKMIIQILNGHGMRLNKSRKRKQ